MRYFTSRRACYGGGRNHAEHTRIPKLNPLHPAERSHTVLVIAVMGPVSWLAMTAMAVTTPEGGPSLANLPQAAQQLLGLFNAFGAIPRMVLGPVLLVIEGATFLLGVSALRARSWLRRC
jgi:hypothetical protein